MTDLKDAYHGKIADIDNRLAAKEGEVDAFIWGCDVPDPFLHGNGYSCPACELRREETHGIGGRLDISCNQCGGTGRIARPILDIIADAVAEARIHHWKLDQ